VRRPSFGDDAFRRFFGLPDVPGGSQEVSSAGSGVIVDAGRGYILTNHHVVEQADEIQVSLVDGKILDAEIVGSDAATDIALLKVEGNDLVDMPIGDSENVRVGDFVLAIGNPFGLGQTVTSGIVSALGRTGLRPEKYENFIQTDAPINPGNSGGALVNSKGELMGINTAIVAPTGGNVGIGFAVPSNMAKRVMRQLVKYGEVRRGTIGVVIRTLTRDDAEKLKTNVRTGAVIEGVRKGSPAERAGLKIKDVIVAIDDRAVRNSGDVRNYVGLKERGSLLRISFVRQGRKRSVKVRIGGG